MRVLVPILMVILSQDGSSKPRDVEPGKVFKGHGTDVYDVTFSPAGNLFATASFDKTVKIWSLETGKELATVRGHTGKVLSVAFNAEGSQLLSAGNDNTLRLWNVSSPGPRSILSKEAQVEELVLSADGKFLVYLSADKKVCIWDRR